jgi:predicted phosphodiesterase
MHVLVLNSEIPLTAGSPQYAFAEADLRGTSRRWKLVMVHKPAYCAGGHGEDTAMIGMSTGIFEKTGVDLVLNGHSHFYQHNFVNGIHHMVIGSAGAPLYDPAHAWYTRKSLKEFNWAVADVTPASLSLYVYNDRGTPLDTLLLKK